MPARRTLRLPLALASVLLLVLVAPFAAETRSTSAAADEILRIGTMFYVDTLNPLVGIETNDTTAYTMIFPQLVQYAPGPKIAGDWASSWTRSKNGLVWTFKLRKGKWSDGVPLTANDAVWTINTVLKYKGGPTSYVASCRRGNQAGVLARSADRGDHVLAADRAGAFESRAVLHPAPARMVEAGRQERQGPEGILAAEEPPDRRGRAVHGVAVRAEGHDGLQAQSALLRPEVEVGGGDVDLLHELGVDDG